MTQRVASAFASDRRVEPRVQLEVEVGLESEHTFYTGLSGNISEGGLFVATHVPPPPSSEVRVRLVLPGEAPLELAGVVRWIRDLRACCDGMPPGCGIAWSPLPNEARMAIERFIAGRDTILYDP
jgi:uncharacterized protein (TIGR02266 family)